MLAVHVRVLSCICRDRILHLPSHFAGLAVWVLRLAEAVEEERLERLRIEKRRYVLLELRGLVVHSSWRKEAKAGEEESIALAV